MFDEYLTRWNLTPDGEPIITRCSQLLPVRHNDAPAMLKIAGEAEEKFGGLLMQWWDGDGAATVLNWDGDALLLERAEGTQTLKRLAHSGATGDDEATRIICRAVARLHTPRNRPAPDVIPLTEWFRELEPMARTHGGILARSLETAQELLQTPQDVVALHGDIHHDNVLDFGPRGWLVIDPKRLGGERGFDYANLFTNPDRETATAPGRLARQVTIVCEEAKLERKRLLQWVLAWSGLSAAWILGDGESPERELTIAEMAAGELG